MPINFATNVNMNDTYNMTAGGTNKIGTAANRFMLNDSGNFASFYGTCATGASTAAKAVVCSVFTDANLVEGTTIRVKFTNSNTATTPTLKINSGTAKNIYKYGTTKPGKTGVTSWTAGAIVTFVYNGSAWLIDSYQNQDTTVTQSAVVTTDGEYCLLHSSATGTADTDSTAITKSSATINPSTGQITMKGKPVLYGEYSASIAPGAPVTGQLWIKDSVMSIEEAKVLIVTITTSSLPATISNNSITADMVVIKSEISNPFYQSGDLTVETASTSATIYGTLTGSTTIKLWLMRSR